MNSRELCESGGPLDVWAVHQFQSSASWKRQEIRSEPLTFILVFQVRLRVEVLLVEGAHQFDVHSPDCDMVKFHCVHPSDYRHAGRPREADNEQRA